MIYDPQKLDREEFERNLADDELQRIIFLKEKLIDLIDGVRRYFSNSGTLNSDDLKAWEAIQEEEFDERFYKSWHDNLEISKSIEWSTEIPSCASLREKNKK